MRIFLLISLIALLSSFDSSFAATKKPLTDKEEASTECGVIQGMRNSEETGVGYIIFEDREFPVRFNDILNPFLAASMAGATRVCITTEKFDGDNIIVKVARK